MNIFQDNLICSDEVMKYGLKNKPLSVPKITLRSHKKIGILVKIYTYCNTYFKRNLVIGLFLFGTNELVFIFDT